MLAAKSGYKISLVEIACADERTAKMFAKRNKHGVPTRVVLTTWKNWEKDERSNVLRPWMGTVPREGDCYAMKVYGKCSNGDKCRFLHDEV